VGKPTVEPPQVTLAMGNLPLCETKIYISS
jgi:hypothetical protein